MHLLKYVKVELLRYHIYYIIYPCRCVTLLLAVTNHSELLLVHVLLVKQSWLLVAELSTRILNYCTTLPLLCESHKDRIQRDSWRWNWSEDFTYCWPSPPAWSPRPRSPRWRSCRSAWRRGWRTARWRAGRETSCPCTTPELSTRTDHSSTAATTVEILSPSPWAPARSSRAGTKVRHSRNRGRLYQGVNWTALLCSIRSRSGLELYRW